MANGDLDEAETEVRDHPGFETGSYGRVIGRIIRHLRALTNAVIALKARVDRLDPP